LHKIWSKAAGSVRFEDEMDAVGRGVHDDEKYIFDLRQAGVKRFLRTDRALREKRLNPQVVQDWKDKQERARAERKRAEALVDA
jgi:hypothetical protein